MSHFDTGAPKQMKKSSPAKLFKIFFSSLLDRRSDLWEHFFPVTSQERCRCHNSQHVRGSCVESKYNQIKVKHGPYLEDTLHPRTALKFNAGYEIKRAIQRFL